MDHGTVLGGRYRLVERLGEGGMSVVWRAQDEVLARPVAVKLLSPRFLTDASSRQRIRAEAQAVAKLSHPNIAGVFDYGESAADVGDERVPYIVMELLSGSTLAEELEQGPLPIARVLKTGAEVAAALAAAHEQDIVHRDVKPANVMVTAGGTAKVVDFGVAAVIGDLAEHRTDAVLFGTPAYVSPERLEGGPVVAGTDVYGLGVLLYRMLTGHMPWSAESTTQMLIAHMYVEPEPLPPLTGLPGDVMEICQACLEKDPADRPSAAEVAAVLAASAASAAGKAAASESGFSRSAVRRLRSHPTPSRRARRLAVAGAAIAVAIAATVSAALVRADGTPANSSPAAAAKTGPTAAPEVSVGVGGVPVPSSSGTRSAGEPGVIDPRQTGPGVVTTSAPGGPVGGGTTTPTAPVSTPPAPVERSAERLGNSVTVRCEGLIATIVSATPADGWLAHERKPGPAEQVSVKFESPDTPPQVVGFRARCVDGIPRINPIEQ